MFVSYNFFLANSRRMLPTFMPRIGPDARLCCGQELDPCTAVSRGGWAWPQQPVDLSHTQRERQTHTHTATLIFILEKSHFGFAFHLVSLSFLLPAPAPPPPPLPPWVHFLICLSFPELSAVRGGVVRLRLSCLALLFNFQSELAAAAT